jgi:hypothetical protein
MASDERSSNAGQIVASIIVAVLIVVLTIALVTAKLGPNSEDGGRSDRRSEDHSGPG